MNDTTRKSSEKKDEIDYDDAVELAGNGAYNYGLLAVCSIISNAVAVDMFGFGLVVATSSCDLDLTIEQKGILSSMPFAGLLFSYLWGYFADTRGRRKAILWSTSIGFIFSALTSISSSFQMMVILKFIGSSFSTASFTLTITLLGECTCSKYRGQYLFIMNSVNVASEAVSFFLGFLLLPFEFSIPVPWLNITLRSWRLYTFAMACPLAIGAVTMYFFHESPKFLANKGDVDKSLEVLKDIYKKNGGNGEFSIPNLKCVKSKESESFWESLKMQTVPIFKPPLLWRTLQMYYLLTIICATNHVFVMWFPTMVNSFYMSLGSNSADDEHFCDRIVNTLTNSTQVEEMGCNDKITDSTLYAGMAYGLFYTCLNLLVSRLSAWRRWVLLVIFIICAISGVLVNLITDSMASMIFFMLFQGTSIAIGIAASYFVDLYHTSYRGMVSCLGFMVARLGTLGGVNIVGAAFNSSCTIVFYLWALYIFSGVVVAYFLPKDTKLQQQKLKNNERMELHYPRS